MSGFRHWVEMGGYAAFVWPAYAVAVAILGGITGQTWWRYRASQRALDRLQGGSRQRR
jgi:heme exporter protein D